MSDRFFDPIVLGHNAFFGVDHLSAIRGQERAAQFSDPRRILGVIEFAYDQGATGLMMSTHERASALIPLLRADSRLSKSLRVYPLLPYMQKYVTAANEKGLINVAADTLSKASAGDKWSMLWSGAKAMLWGDTKSILTGLMTAELGPFKGLNIPCVFLHDVLTDLALALDLREIMEFYHEEMEKTFRTRAAFATKNPGVLVSKFEKWKLPKPLAMCHVNRIGFSMNPSREACEDVLRHNTMKVMAMSTLASGFLRPDEAYSYVSQFPCIESVVVGASSKEHVTETFDSIRKHMGRNFSS